MNPAVSISLPADRVEKYFRECDDFLLCQTLRGFKVICVDNGSPDLGVDVADDYARADVRVRVFHEQHSNAGHRGSVGSDLPFGYYFWKVVLGSVMGNVGEVLKYTGSPVFDPNGSDSVVEATKSGLRLSDEGLWGENRHLADNWTPEIVACGLIRAYESVFS